MSFEVKIDVFEGPFDLLLRMITSQEMDIHQVPIAEIADSYLEHLEAAEYLDLDTATEFLVIAATLLLLKARSLLPPEEESEEEEDAESAREYLLERLIEYQTFSNAASHLAERYSQNGWFIPRMREIEEDYAHLYPDPFEGVDVRGLPQALMDLLVERAGAPTVDISYLAPVKVSVEEQVEKVRETLEKEDSTTFEELAEACGSKLEVVAMFLAILELFKSGEVDLRQKRAFGRIEIKTREGERDSAA